MLSSPRPKMRKRLPSETIESDETSRSRLNDQLTRKIEGAKFLHSSQLDDELFETTQGSSSKAATQAMRAEPIPSTPAWEIENAKFLHSLQLDDKLFESTQGLSSSAVTKAIETGQTLFPKRVVSQGIRPKQNEAKLSTWALRGASVLSQDTFFQPINQPRSIRPPTQEKSDVLEEAIAQSAVQLGLLQVVDVEDGDENGINLTRLGAGYS